MYCDGMVVLTASEPPAPQGGVNGGGTAAGRRVWAVTSLSEPRPVLMAALPHEVAVQAVHVGPRLPADEIPCMAILEPHLTASGGLEVGSGARPHIFPGS